MSNTDPDAWRRVAGDSQERVVARARSDPNYARMLMEDADIAARQKEDGLPIVLSQRDWLAEAPRIRQVTLIEARFYRGEGDNEGDPVREVVAYYREDGTPMVEIDPFMEDS